MPNATPARSIAWVEQATENDTLHWRQTKREPGQYPPVLSDRSTGFRQRVQTKKATKTTEAVWDDEARYTDTEKKKLAAIFTPLVDALKEHLGTVLWWHFDTASGQLMVGRQGNEREHLTNNDLVLIADSCMAKFTDALSKIHGNAITPAR